MFLFKKRKDGPQEKTMLDKTEAIIKLAKENNKENSKLKNSSESGDKRNQGKPNQSGNIHSGSQTAEADAPMKVVIPASSLLEDQDVLTVRAPEANGSAVPEEDLDKLLVKVNKSEPAVEAPDISLDILAPPKEAASNPKSAMIQPEVKKEVPEIKVEVKSEPKSEVKSESKPATKADAKPAETAPNKDTKPEEGDKGNLFSNLFGKVEVEEDNPLKKLMNSLPDISMDEVMIEVEEVKGLISEWYVNHGKHVLK